MTALTTGVGTLDNTDSSIDINEFSVNFSGDQLIVSNSQGRALAIEEFSSTHGFMTVTPINEPGASQILASQNAYFSETRVQLNTSTFGTDMSATDTNKFTFTLDGVNSATPLAISVDGSATNSDLASGSNFASAVQTAVNAAVVTINNPNTGSSIATAQFRTSLYHLIPTRQSLVFRDSKGRAMGFPYGVSGTLTTSNGPL